jgi:hexosaminidase
MFEMKTLQNDPLHLVPYPESAVRREGTCSPDAEVRQCLRPLPGGEEAYELEIAADGITETGAEQGLIHAEQTLAQLRLQFPDRLPCLVIRDKPRFAWRGFMLDSSRHFLPEPDVMTLIDAAAFFKLNRFHWHLTDDQGWRIEIERFPRLAEIGSRRGKAYFGDFPEPEESHGFFTKKQVRRIVAFARERGVEIIPEIEIPGHETAAIAAYPELGCTGQSMPVAVRPGIFDNLICAGREENYQFLCGVLDEIMELFPYPVIHIGGDEACKAHWRNCPYCQAKIKELGLSDENALQQWLVKRIGAYLSSKGRTPVVWNDSLRGSSLPPDFIVQSWMGDHERIADFCSRGGKVIQSDCSHYYMDYPYFRIDVGNILKADPYPDYLDGQQKKQVIGLEAPLWTERVPDLQTACRQLFPRLSAVAEAAWTPAPSRDNDSFAERYEGCAAQFEKRRLKGAAPRSAWFMDEAAAAADRAEYERITGTPEFLRMEEEDEKRMQEEQRIYGKI